MSWKLSSKNRNRVIAALSVAALSTQGGAVANERCPLSNPAYRDIRLAAAKLQEKLTLPTGCEKVETQLQQMGTTLKDAVDGLYKADLEKQKLDGTPPTAADIQASNDAKLRLKSAIDGVQGLSNILARYSNDPSNKCGKALLTKTDFFEALIDTVNGMAPFIMLYGGAQAAPLVLSATLIASVGRTFVSLFKNTPVDMGDPKMRQMFIENSCAFHTFNQNFEALQDREEQLEQARRRVIQLETELQELEKQGPPQPAPGYELFAEVDGFVRQVQADLKSYAEVGDRLAFKDLFACEYVRQKIDEEVAGKASGYLEQLMALGGASGAETLADRQLIRMLSDESRPELYPADETQLQRCGVRARGWLDLFRQTLDRINAHLDRPGRREPALRETRKWEELRSTKGTEVKSETARIRWLETLGETGEAIENSEIAQARDDSRDALFATKNRKALFGIISVNTPSPAHQWLKNKNEAALKKLLEYQGYRKELNDHWLGKLPDPTQISDPALREEGCAKVKSAILSWMIARSHITAAQSFCSTFRYDVTDTFYPEVAGYCFVRKRFLNERRPSVNQETSEQVAKFEAEVQKGHGWLKIAGCPLPKKAEIPKS